MIRIAAWNAVFLALVILIAELAFGGWMDSIRAPSLWRLSIYRNVAWTFAAADQYGRRDPILYRRDRFGLRGNYGAPGDVDILVLGGSTTDERFVTEGETWTDVFARCLSDAGRATRVANAGIAGQSTRGHIRNFDVWLNHIPGLKPRHALAYIGVNEPLLESRVNEDDVEQYRESALPLWLERLKLNSALYALYRAATGNLAAWRAGIHHLGTTNAGGEGTRADGIDRQWHRIAANSLAVASDEHTRRLAAAKAARKDDLATYRERLARLAQAIRAFGAEPVFVTQTAAGFRIEGGVIRGGVDDYLSLRAFNDATMAFCEQNGLSCFDLGRAFATEDGDFYDPVHMTPRGSAKAGTMICHALAAAPGFTAYREIPR